MDESGVPVEPDDKQVGEIRVRGETVTPGRWSRPDATAEAFRDGKLIFENGLELLHHLGGDRFCVSDRVISGVN